MRQCCGGEDKEEAVCRTDVNPRAGAPGLMEDSKQDPGRARCAKEAGSDSPAVPTLTILIMAER